MAVFLAFMESVVLLLLFDLRSGNVLLVSVLIDLRVAHIGLSAHFEDVVWFWRISNTKNIEEKLLN